MNLRLFLVCFTFFSHGVYSQNLVPNPGFEEFYKCPVSYNSSTDGLIAPGWSSPSTGTPDLFNSCGKGLAGVPVNWAGNSKANSGSGYAGIYVYNNDVKNSYREYLQARFNASMQTNEEYQVEFYFKLSSNSKYSIDRIGILLSDSSSNYTHDGVIGSATYEWHSNKPYDRRTTGLWTKFSYRYKAKGGEKFITIGNFSTNVQTKNFYINSSKSKEPLLAQQAYFYIDDVKVLQLSEKPVTLEPYRPNEYYVLKNVQFDFDNYTLKETSFSELQQLVNMLTKHPNWSIIVRGHTDFIGTDEFNLELSKKRASSVAEWLISHGIARTRVKAEGSGKKDPIKDETSDEARAINRRVEVFFIVK
ncbi:hypothetical protein WSM22_08090 [Cytophagales bacterium WSM2-2]|nr:hypothetical protein WSM22_08090 [Cytophagales bacterium WSM2-2]